jgi:hypothetical protein
MGEERLVGLIQPDQRSCGAAVLVAARLLAAPRYGTTRAARLAATPEWFRTEVLALHRRITSARDVSGRWQLPWPRLIGTPPWAIAHHLSAVTGRPHHTRLVLNQDTDFEQVLSAVTNGNPVPLYVGSRWLPRHVVLVTGHGPEDALRCYDPARGAVVTVAREAFVSGRLTLSRWNRPWFTILPRGRRTRA